MNAILVSSDHSFPMSLRNKRLVFNIMDLNGYIFANEVSPVSMMKLLMDEWGVKENLALALVSHYGGNIYDVYLALPYLMVRSKYYALNSQLSLNVSRCLTYRDKHPDIIEVLSLLCEKGYAPRRDCDDDIAKILSENRVAGIMSGSSESIGISRDQFGRYDYILVPSAQSMRLAIGVALMKLKENQQAY